MLERFQNLRISCFIISTLLIISSCDVDMPWAESDEELQEEFPDTSLQGDTIQEQDVVDEVGSDTAESADYYNDEVASDSVTEKDQAELPGASNRAEQWRLVISSLATRELAERFVEKRGETQAEIIYVDELGTYRVVHSSHSNLQQAQQEYQRISGQYPDAWLVYF